MGFIANARAIGTDERRGLLKAVVDALEIVNSSPNFAQPGLVVLLRSTKETTAYIVDRRSGQVVAHRKPKFVDVDKYVKSLTLSLSVVLHTPAPFFDSFSCAEDQGTARNER